MFGQALNGLFLSKHIFMPFRTSGFSSNSSASGFLFPFAALSVSLEAEEQSKHLFRLRLQKHWAIYRHNLKLSTCVRLRSAYGNLTKDHRTIHVYLLCMIIVKKLGQIMIVNVVDSCVV